MYYEKNSSKSWFILGLVFLVLLFSLTLLNDVGILYVSYGAEILISAVFGFGGTLFLLIGIIKLIISKIKK